MNKKIQLMVIVMVIFSFNTSVVVASGGWPSDLGTSKAIIVGTRMEHPDHRVFNGYYKIAIPRDTANSMQSYGYGPPLEDIQQAERSYVWVNQYEFDEYVEKRKKTSDGAFPWGGRTAAVGIITGFAGGKNANPVPRAGEKWSEISDSTLKDLRSNQLERGRGLNLMHDSKGRVLVPEREYNQYYNDLSIWGKIKHNFNTWSSKKPSSSTGSGSGVLKSFASVPMTQPRTQPTRFSTYFSKITLPKAIPTPSPAARSEFATTPEGEIFSKPVQKYEIVPGSPADKFRKWWNKGR